MDIDQVITMGGLLLGGLGLFLLAVGMITDGLKVAAGEALRDMLGKWTSTLPRGIAAGVGITALVQSSSAVTVATIGFVNAGLLSLDQALAVVYGANIGTTMTGWLVAALGFKIKVEAFALPMIGLGMLLRLTGPGMRRAALGEALAGFGLFFIGIDVLKGAFEGLAAAVDLQAFAPGGVWGEVLFVGLGFLMTTLMQSSSAAIAIVLTAATGGVLALDAAAAMVIGANVGTTSTAVLAVIGATPNAKRVAAAHIFFNLVTGAVALILLPAMLWLVAATGRVLGMAEVPAVTLALFHTSFNILGVLLLWPVTDKLARWLGRRFQSQEEIASRPRYLDNTVIVTPALAVNALSLELDRISDMARKAGLDALAWERLDPQGMERNSQALATLNIALGEFVAHLERNKLPADIAERLPQILRSGQYFFSVAELALALAKSNRIFAQLSDEPLKSELGEFRHGIRELLASTDTQAADFDAAVLEARLKAVIDGYEEVKREVLEAGARSQIKISDMATVLEQLSRMRRLAEQAVKGTRDLAALHDVTNNDEQQAAEQAGIPG